MEAVDDTRWVARGLNEDYRFDSVRSLLSDAAAVVGGGGIADLAPWTPGNYFRRRERVRADYESG